MPHSETTGATAVESPVVDGLRLLYAAFQQTSIHASGNPAAVEATVSSSLALSAATAGGDSLLICVGRDRLVLDGETLRDASGELEALAGLLHELDISALRIDAGLEADEMDGLVQALGRAHREGFSGDDLSEVLEQCHVRHLRIVSAEAESAIPDHAENIEKNGDAGIEPALAALVRAESPSTIDMLQGFLSDRDFELLRPALERRLPRGWGHWQKIFVLLRRLPLPHATELAERLLRHDEFEVRREALILLHDLGGDRALRLRELRRALTDDSARFARVAVRCLAEMGGDDAIETLGAYLDGSLGVTPLFDAGVRAAHSLLRLKGAGVARLCLAAERMSRSVAPRRVRLARKVVELLATEDDPRAVRCVRRWRFSAARLAGILAGRPGKARTGP